MSFSRRISLIVAAAFFMETLDGAIVTTALPAIAASFHRETLSLTLGISAYLVAAAAFVPTAGWMSDRFGAREVFACAIAVFTASSLLCGLSTSPWTFIAARSLQGAAAAFMSPVGRLVVLRETPKQYIIEAIGVITWPALIAPVVGPPLAGFLTTYASWRWIFFLNIPLGVLGIVLVLRQIPRHARGAPLAFDHLGFALTAVALAVLVQGLSAVSARGQLSGSALLWIGAGLAGAVLAVRHALRHPAPMLDLRSVRIPTFTLSTLSAGMLSRIAISTTPFLLPLMYQIGFGMRPFEAGLMLLVYMLGNLVMKSVTTPTLHRFGFPHVLQVNGTLCALAIAACGFFVPGMSLLVVYPVLFIAGMTRSMHYSAVNTLAFVEVSTAQRPGASTLSAMAQQLASTLSVAVAAVGLAASQRARGAAMLGLTDFHRAFWAAGTLMALGTLWTLRLPRDAGAEATRAR